MKRILLLDDDQDNLTILTFILESAGHEVKALASGENVFELIAQYDPHLLLMDVRLGMLDGRIICRNIKENALTAGLPVILISGLHNLEDVLQQTGAPNDCIAKPYDIDYLQSRVEKQLNNTN